MCRPPNKGDFFVNSHCLNSLMLFADGAVGGDNPPARGVGGSEIWIQLLPFLLIGLLFYFMLIRPQRREHAKRQDMLSNVKKNDRVVTIGGIYGVVVNVHREADEITIKVDEATNTKLRVTLASISRVISGEPAEEESKK
jgi:preprotein translocase subunit YajC